MRVLMLFLDGVGMGDPDPAVNPLFAARLPFLRSMMGGVPSLLERSLESDHGVVVPLDATLGVEGLPQSGTGQASLLAGFNAPRKAGHHFGPHPPASIRPVIAEKNVFRRVMDAGLAPCFVNAFPQRFFDYIEAHQFRLSMTTLSCMLSGLSLRQEPDLRKGEAVSADLTREGWREMGYTDLPVLTPQESGRHLAALTAQHHFTLFEYWKTDFAGHAQNMAESVVVLERFDAMLEGLLSELDLHQTLIVLSSDHGNIENLSVKTHTRNPVPLLLYGRSHHAAASHVSAHSRPTLAHVTPMIMHMLTGE